MHCSPVAAAAAAAEGTAIASYEEDVAQKSGRYKLQTGVECECDDKFISVFLFYVVAGAPV